MDLATWPVSGTLAPVSKDVADFHAPLQQTNLQLRYRFKDPVMTMKKVRPQQTYTARNTPRMGPAALHGSASSPGLPNLAGAQIPGPGAKHLLYGEDGRLSDAAADPWELEGHLGSRGGLRRFLDRIFGR
jgi:hypothetical protein